MKQPIFLILAVACSGQPSRTPTPPTETGSLGAASEASIVTVDTATVEIPIALASQLYVEHDATVYARSAGIVESILVDLGSRVAAGQPIARLESTDQRIVLAKAREKFANSRQVVERQRALKAAGFVTQAESERIEFEHREAVLSLRQARRDYDLTRIVAPFAGVVTGRMARVHRMVNTGDSLFRVTALAPVLATLHVPESTAGGIRIGTEAEIVGPGAVTARARVIRASPVIDAGSGTREMILQLRGEPRLTPGTSVMVRLGSQRRQVVTIPRSAVGQDGYAMVWTGDRTTLRAVTLGGDVGGDLIEVVSGLTPGERIVRTAP